MEHHHNYYLKAYSLTSDTRELQLGSDSFRPWLRARVQALHACHGLIVTFIQVCSSSVKTQPPCIRKQTEQYSAITNDSIKKLLPKHKAHCVNKLFIYYEA